MRLYHQELPAFAQPLCVFLNPNKKSDLGMWDGDGCFVYRRMKTFTECRCNHLTNFAILVDISGQGFSERDDYILSCMSLIFCCLSAIALTVTIIIYVSVRSLRSRRSTITCNLCVCLLCTNILVQSGLKRSNTKMCLVMSGLLQYCVLCAFSWMLMEGILLYRMVIMVFQMKKVRLVVIYSFSYGIPFIITLLSSFTNPDDMIREKYCWPSSTNGHIWGVAGPMLLVIAVNLVIFALTLNAAARIDNMNALNESHREQKKILVKRMKGMVSLTCLLGLTWLIGFFTVSSTPPIASYLFVILNGLQGVFLFVTQLLLNDSARQKLFLIYKQNMAKFSTVSSNWNSAMAARKPDDKENIEGKESAFYDVVPPILFTLTPPQEQDPAPSAPPTYDTCIRQPVARFWIDESNVRHPFELNHEAFKASLDSNS